MARAQRRWADRVAKARKVRILKAHGAWREPYWIHSPAYGGEREWAWGPKRWQDYDRLLMNEPGWWIRYWVTQPARIRSNRLERLIEKGMDPEQIWPDYKRPHNYYW